MTPLKNHFSNGICAQLKHELNIEFVEEALRYTDEALLRVRGFGKIALTKLKDIENDPLYIGLKMEKQLLESPLLPSDLQIQERCTVTIGRNTLYGKVSGISFIKGKYFYDVDVEFQMPGQSTTRIHRIEAYLVKKFNH